MSYRIQVHITGEDPVVIDVDELPHPQDNFVMGMNPQRRDGKDVNYVMREVNTIILPWHRINFIQILPGEREEVLTFIRE